MRCTDGIDGDEVWEETGFLFVVDMALATIGMLFEGNFRVTESDTTNIIAVANDGNVTRLLTSGRIVVFVSSSMNTVLWQTDTSN